MKRLQTLLSLIIFISFSGISQIIHVPNDYTSIQEAINTSTDGDTILVAEGIYPEIINFKGKAILVASNYAIDGNPDHILNTIIDGSNFAGQDTASVVLFIHGEGPESILEGFTITGGTGTVWEDEHGPGNFYTEGGGILVQAAAPTIKNNIIRNNEAVNTQGSIISAGGGAIRSGDGNPTILNNIIFENAARYGGGIVLNYSGASIRNNIIAYNSGGNDYGGGGLWIIDNGLESILVANNTIVHNASSTTAGGIRVWNSSLEIQNNIIRENTAAQFSQIQGAGQQVNYCNVEGGYSSGEGNIDEDPMFESLNYLLQSGSPCIDAGFPDAGYNDPEDAGNPGNAMYPAMGNLRNDMGVYGGPFSMGFPSLITAIEEPASNPVQEVEIYPNPCKDFLVINYTSNRSGIIDVDIHSILGQHVVKVAGGIHQPGEHHALVDVRDLPPGLYVLNIRTGKQMVSKKLLIAK